MNARTIFSKYAFWPLYRNTKGKRWKKRMEEFKKAERLPVEFLFKRQLNALKTLLRYSYEKVPYYTRLFKKANIEPQDIRDFKDLRKIPFLTKKDMIDNIDDMTTPDLARRGGYINSSGGSTGVNLRFYQDKLYQIDRAAGVYWGNELAGWKTGIPTAYLWGVDDNPRGKIKNSLLRACRNEIFLNTFEVTEKDMDRFYKKIRNFKTEFIIGYASSIVMFFRFLANRGLDIPSMQGVISSAEVLPKNDREFLENICGLNVFDRYGSREVGLIAAECEKHKGLHVFTDGVYVENVQYDNNAKEGEVVVTSLINYAMPLIRYKIEDIGTLLQDICPCGRTLPRITSIKGRMSDIFTTPDGKLVHGEYFTHLFYPIKQVNQFQLIQKSKTYFILNLIPDSGFNDNVIREIENKIREKMGRIELKTYVLDRITPSRSGKRLFTISEVPVNR